MPTVIKENIIQEKSFQFSLLIIDLYKEMIAQNEYVLSKQLLRSGTSIGANVEEALAGISKRDFTAKMSIASKEARESKYWPRLIDKGDLVNVDVGIASKEINSIINLLTKIVKTSQTNTKC